MFNSQFDSYVPNGFECQAQIIDFAPTIQALQATPTDLPQVLVQRALEVNVEHARVDRGGLLARARVYLRPHAVEDLVDLQRRVLGRALEQQVLEQVREPRLGVGFVARAGADPEPERHRPDGGHVLRHHAHALHSPYWWLKCAYGIDNTEALPVRKMHDLLTYQIVKQPKWLDRVDRALNPVLGKSLIVYTQKVAR